MAPVGARVTPAGAKTWAAVAGPPSPEKPGAPFPAIVVIVPPESILRIRLLLLSARSTEPAGPSATAVGWFRAAAVAGPPSPLYPAAPVPAIVVITPPGLTFRIRLFPESANTIAPAASTTTPAGSDSCAALAAPPSPL